MAIRQLEIQLDLNTGQFTSKITNAAGQIQKLGSAVNSVDASISNAGRRLTGFGTTLRDLVITISQVRGALFTLHHVSTQWIASIIKQNAEIERMTNLMAGLSNAADRATRFQEAEQNVQRLISMAKQAPFSVQALSDSFVKLKSGGIDPTTGSLQSLVDGVAAFGGTEQNLHRASIAIQQMAGKGVISMEELRQQLGEAVPRAINLMAVGMGMSYSELVNRISQGQVKAGTALEKMFAQFDLAFGGRAQEMMNTFNGLLSQLKTSYTEFSLQAGKAGAFDAIKTQLRDLVAFLQSPEATGFATVLGQGIASVTEALRGTLEFLLRYRDELANLGKMLLVVWGAGKVVSGIMALHTAIASLAGVTGILTTATATYHSAAWAALGVLTSLRMGSIGAAQAFGVAAAAAGVLGRSFVAMAGPIGIAVAAIWTIIDAFNLFESAADRARESNERFKDGLAGEKDIKNWKERVAELRVELQGLYEEARNPNIRPGPLTSVLNRIAPLEKELGELENNIKATQDRLQRSDIDKVVREKMAKVTDEIDTARGELSKATSEYEKALDKNGAITDRALRGQSNDQARDVYLKAVETFYDRQLEIIGRGKQQAETLSKDQAETVRKAGAALLNQLSQEEAQVREQRRRTMEALGKDNQFTVDVNSPKGQRNIEVALDGYRARVAELRAELGGTSGELAKVQSQLANGVFKEVTAQEAEEIRRLAAEQDKLTESIKKQKEVRDQTSQAWDAISARYRTAQDRVRQLVADLTAADGIYEPRSLRSAIATLDEYGRRLAAGSEEQRRFAAERENMVGALRQEFALDQLTGIAEKTKEINRGLLEDERKARNQAVSEEEARVRRLLELANLEGEAKVEMERQVNAYIKALRDDLVRQNETASERLLRQWQNVTERLKEAQADWLQNGIDGIVEFARTGKFEFGKFVEDVIADFARIQIRNMLGGPINTLLQGFTNFMTGAITGAIGGPSKTVQQAEYAKSVGLPMRVAGNHSGGLVGAEATFMRTVDSSIFANAKRFHAGGLPGLRTDEVPTILKKGEGVFTPEQMRALGRGGPTSVNVNVINQSGQNVTAEQGTPRFDGEQMVLDVVLKAAGRPGPFRDSLKQVIK